MTACVPANVTAREWLCTGEVENEEFLGTSGYKSIRHYLPRIRLSFEIRMVIKTYVVVYSLKAAFGDTSGNKNIGHYLPGVGSVWRY
jgi:hypothetical protein